MLQDFLSVFISLLVIIDPLGTAAIFLGLTTGLTIAQRNTVAIKASVMAIILLLFFGFAGKFLLEYMGISLNAFRITGGILLFVTAYRMVMGMQEKEMDKARDYSAEDLSSLAVFPLAIPLLAGPGCITVTILNLNEVASPDGRLMVTLSIIVVQLLALVSMLSVAKITKIIGKTGSDMMARITGIILAALSIQFIIDGIMGAINVVSI